MIDRRVVLLGGLAGLSLSRGALGQGPGGGPGPAGAGGGPGGFPAQGGAQNNAAPPRMNQQGEANPQNAQQPIQAFPPQPARIQAMILSQSYQSTPQFALANTRRDGELIARTFQRLRFDQVTVRGDGTSEETMADLVTYLRSVDNDTIAIVYLAGHGMEVGGENLLMLDGGTTFLSLQALVQTLQARAGVAILFLDACRNNPFRNAAASAQVSRAVSLGENQNVQVQTVGLGDLLSRYSETLSRLRAFSVQGSGIKIVFSTDPANVALDGARPNSRNSPFAEALSRRIRNQMSLDDIVSLTTGDVLRATRGAQSPWSQGSIDRPIFLSGRRRMEQRNLR